MNDTNRNDRKTYTWKAYFTRGPHAGQLAFIAEQAAKSRNVPKRTIRESAKFHAEAGQPLRFSRIKTL
jgi:hypothetical protein